MPLMLGTATPNKLYRGAGTVARVYKGRDVAWVSDGIPTITSFAVQPAQLNRAHLSQYSHVSLAWNASGFDTLGVYATGPDGVRHSVPFVAGDDHTTYARPSENTVFALEATNAAGTAIAHASFTIVAEAAIQYFRVRSGSFSQAPNPGGGTIGTMTLEWHVTGEPFPEISLSAADGHGSFDYGARRDHTNHATGLGELRLSAGLGNSIRPVRYQLSIRNSQNEDVQGVTFNWPQG